MGLCFGFSVVVTTLSTFVKIRIDKLATQGAKETLAVGVKGMMRFMYFLYQGTIILFFLGFIQIGYIKPGFSLPWDPSFTVPIVAIGSTGLAVSVLFNICEAMDLGPGKKVCARSMYEKENASLNTTNDSTYDGWKARSTQRNLSYAVQASFVAGNSFFEVLFTDLQTYDESTVWASYTYIICNVITTVAGCVVVVLSTAVAVNLVDNRTLVNVEGKIFNLFTLMTLSWMWSLLALDKAKYDVRLWGVTFYWALFGVWSFGVSFHVLRAIRATDSIIIEQGIAGDLKVKKSLAQSVKISREASSPVPGEASSPFPESIEMKGGCVFNAQ